MKKQGIHIVVAVTNDLIQDQRMHRICDTLQSAGYKVTLVGREKSGSKDVLNMPFAQHRMQCFFQSGVLFYLEYNLRLLLHLLRIRPDVIYSVDLDTLGACGLASRLSKGRLVHDAHEYFTEVPELQGAGFKKWIWYRLGLSMIPRADLCISVNEELAAVLSKEYGNEFGVIRSVPMLDQTNTPVVVNKRKNIIYQGMLNKGRGLEQAIRAVATSDMDVRLQIVGEGDLSTELRELAIKVDVKDKIEFLGWKLPDELRQITKEAWLGLNLLDASSLNYKFSLANKFFDYMHAGVPSINMNFPTYRRYIQNNKVGLLLETLDVDEIKTVIQTVYDNEFTYNELKSNCETAKRKHNWQNESKKLLAMIENVIG